MKFNLVSSYTEKSCSFKSCFREFLRVIIFRVDIPYWHRITLEKLIGYIGTE